MIEENNKKTIGRFYPFAIVLIVFAEIVRNLYYILTTDVQSIDVSKPVGYFVLILYVIALRAIVPGLIDMLITLIMGSSLARRGFREIMSRRDFMTITLFFLAGAKIVAGCVDLFGYLSETAYIYSVAMADVILIGLAMALEYFCVIAPKLDAYRKKRIVFGVLSSIFLIWQAIVTAGPCLVVILIYYYQNVPEIATLFEDYKYAASDVIPCSIALGIYGLLLIAILVYKFVLGKLMAGEQPNDGGPTIRVRVEETPPQPQQDIDPFEEVDDWDKVDKGEATNADINNDKDPFDL
ncbi:MAG: hypothetical protein J5656_00155 [Clostridia bacterium]|nr:hypothetical protein [Clostridia bacterium]